MDELEGLVRRLRAGIDSEESARRLDGWLRPRLGRYFRARGFVHHEIDDLVQQTLVRVFRNIGELQAEAAFLGWLFVVARNVGRSARRSRAREGEVLVRAGESHAGNEPAAPATSGVPEGRLRLAEIAEAVAELPGQQRRCLVLAARDGLSYAEIGELLGLSPLTVRNHLAEARRRLRRRLGEGGGGG
ncbi:MAG: RNA polymerase sigma factor [Thermoanaerobaculia bacterium]|jgi:RNA polymerase sigma-70 factor (ECF subfamily)|nr:RNA polymerase sigma factor [Thermoanaerobaculia bacterium]